MARFPSPIRFYYAFFFHWLVSSLLNYSKRVMDKRILAASEFAFETCPSVPRACFAWTQDKDVLSISTGTVVSGTEGPNILNLHFPTGAPVLHTWSHSRGNHAADEALQAYKKIQTFCFRFQLKPAYSKALYCFTLCSGRPPWNSAQVRLYVEWGVERSLYCRQK